ncbi:hypothetical protein TIFTF001_024908 [Ficus carica]|uniref:Uncharacterized protein n=1 Tax=Ficus carica TaxID=3494 RepID=A0AA88DH26_FICCA|nr:hypothetical protein TIFTF001_024908 [Ficus carica]
MYRIFKRAGVGGTPGKPGGRGWGAAGERGRERKSSAVRGGSPAFVGGDRKITGAREDLGWEESYEVNRSRSGADNFRGLTELRGGFVEWLLHPPVAMMHRRDLGIWVGVIDLGLV